jgi:uncharacterized membrane protein YhaH (DUF805 family)
MQTANPYSPPQADVADMPDGGPSSFQSVHFFAWRGRIGRLRLLAYSMLVYLFIAVLGAIAGGITAAAHSSSIDQFLIWAIYLVSFGLMLMVLIQRSHDMDYSGWTALLALIPIVGLLWVFKSGTTGTNRFGAPPVPNSLGVKIAGLLLPIVAVIGILAAIALPAYQSYVQKAKAAQMK